MHMILGSPNPCIIKTDARDTNATPLCLALQPFFYLIDLYKLNLQCHPYIELSEILQ
jgi:hypothetical protein